MTTEEVKKIEEILADEEFLKNLSEAKTDDKVKNLMATKGIVMTDQDMADYKKAAAETAEKLSKMTPEELENIIGGVTAKEAAQLGATGGAAIGTLIGLVGGIASVACIENESIGVLIAQCAGLAVLYGLCGAAAFSAFGAASGSLGVVIKNKMDEIKSKKRNK